MEESAFTWLISKKQKKVCDTADKVLEYMVGDDRLRDVITQVTVLSRTICGKHYAPASFP